MIDRTDLLTWEGIRALCAAEALSAPDYRINLLKMDLRRPILKQGVVDPYPRVPFRPTPGALVFARTVWRHPWREHLLKALTAPAVLVSAFCDPMVKPQAVLEMFPPGSPVQHWFGWQGTTTHPKFTAMPVGVEGSIVPHLQAAERQPWADRPIALYLNYVRTARFSHINAIRRTLWDHYRQLPWVTADPYDLSPQGHAHYAAQLGRSQFVLSPPGQGWDCYRSHEAIAMGAIPIVKRERPVTDVYEDLPVWLVDDWYDITPARMAQVAPALREKSTETITMSYWTRRIQATAARVAEECLTHG